MKHLLILSAAVLMGTSCVPQASSPKADTSQDAHCVMQGNNAERISCATTYIQLLADPDYYDGRRIQLTGWGYSDGEVTILFPSEDSLLEVETHASLLLRETGPSAISERLLSRPHGSGRLVVTGLFRLKGQHQEVSDRLGVLEEAALVR
jgi:hypothetical protein